ncbi:MAG TPA: hypothetical protein VFE51_11625 [Verrucomicrobiae bacterium]|nr:hypothetical protein [Verrucomicrobiae bacterium]
MNKETILDLCKDIKAAKTKPEQSAIARKLLAAANAMGDRLTDEITNAVTAALDPVHELVDPRANLLNDLNESLQSEKDNEKRRGIISAMMRIRADMKVASTVALVLLAALVFTCLPQAHAYITGSPGVLAVDGGAVFTPTTSVATNGYTLVSTDQFIELPATNVTVTLPATLGGGFVNGKEFVFKNLSPHGTNQIVYSGTTGQNIDGQTSWQLTNKFACMHIRCDGTQWYIVSANSAAYIP